MKKQLGKWYECGTLQTHSQHLINYANECEWMLIGVRVLQIESLWMLWYPIFRLDKPIEISLFFFFSFFVVVALAPKIPFYLDFVCMRSLVVIINIDIFGQAMDILLAFWYMLSLISKRKLNCSAYPNVSQHFFNDIQFIFRWAKCIRRKTSVSSWNIWCA